MKHHGLTLANLSVKPCERRTTRPGTKEKCCRKECCHISLQVITLQTRKINKK